MKDTMAKIILTGQNIDIYDGDCLDLYARTGATSLEMLSHAGAEGVIFGHSEVGDSAEVTRKKFQTLLNRRQTFGANFLPKSTILVGETWADFESLVKDRIAKVQETQHAEIDKEKWEGIEDEVKEQIAEVVSKQLHLILEGTPEDVMQEVVVGYEPKWGSRGGGHDDVPPVAPEIISVCAGAMKEELINLFGKDLGNKIPIIYGGRSTPERTEKIVADENIAGLILGSACNTVQKTLNIAHAMITPMGQKTKILHANFKAYNLPDSYEQYVTELKKLDDTFIVYLSPNHTDIRAVKEVL